MIADVAIAVMQERDVRCVIWLDGILDEIASRAGCKGKHPLSRKATVMNALERDSRFEKRMFRGHDSLGHVRLVRSFWLIEP